MTNTNFFPTIDTMVSEGQLSYLANREVAASRQFKLDRNATVGYDAYVMLLVNGGEAEMGINYNQIKLKRGTVLILKPYMLITGFSTDASFEASCLFFDKFFFVSLPESIRFHALQNQLVNIAGVPKVELNGMEYDEVKSAFTSLCGFVPYHMFAEAIMMARLSYILLIVMAAIQRDLETATHTANHKEALFQNFLQTLCLNYAEQHGLEFYARNLCVSVRYLQRVIKEITGRTVYSYICERLMIHARRLLANSDMTIEQIAFSLHFSSASAFSKFFKTNCGISPKQFREEVKVSHK